MILASLSLRFINRKSLIVITIIMVLFLIVNLSTREKRERYKESIKQDPIKHVLAAFIG